MPDMIILNWKDNTHNGGSFSKYGKTWGETIMVTGKIWWKWWNQVIFWQDFLLEIATDD